MLNRTTGIFLIFILLLTTSSAFALSGSSEEAAGQVDTPDEINDYIRHHLQDSHYFTLWTNGKTGHHIGFPLPVILIDEGLHFFMASKFHHGETVAESKGKYYKLYHGKVYETNSEGEITLDDHNHPTNAKPLDISITKGVVGMLLAGLLLLLGFGSLAKNYKSSALPKGIGRVLEPLVIYVRDEIARPNIGAGKYEKYMPYLLTVFFYIWILNLLGLTPLGFNVTGNIAITACLAIFTFIIVQFSGNKEYWKHIFWMPGVPVLMKIVLMPIEILGMFTKPFALMLRLFANMTAGHFVVMSLIALMVTMKSQFGAIGSSSMAFALAFFITIIELLVAFLQAYIFTMLSALFIGMATEEHDH
ncbi:F0F1 ATP synthase subunit A [Marivirga atlantica]|uniref:ATP synthase subunit a n=1 Tax=Marivirga atlantica TaxID=1548457 RepID=A0A937DIL4_9BACT|nr:F0F1 ATP synthase subunit A [Marivirga atlantica]MBL0764301.1 F0F1 ATP synthase subunit A [Marivirga atlantica]